MNAKFNIFTAISLTLWAFIWPNSSSSYELTINEVENENRMNNNPDAFDRTDQYCTGLNPDNACTIPGTILAGGGTGTCKRSIARHSKYIDLKCRLNTTAHIDRKYPETPYQLIDKPCNSSDSLRWSCEKLVMISDQFCRDKKEGDFCRADYRLSGGGSGSEEGVCHENVDINFGYHRGEITLSRPVLNCEAAQVNEPLIMQEKNINK